MWLEMLKGWRDFALELYGVLWRLALVAIVAIATYTMQTRGYKG